MSHTILETVTLESLTCCNCGCTFAIPQWLMVQLRQNKNSFYCPNGHSQHFSRSEADRLKEELATAQAQLRTAKCETLNEQTRRFEAEVAKAKVERKLKRVQKGVCPCCNRTFLDLQRHMASKHPEQKPA